MPAAPRRSPLHYAWVIVFAGVLTLFSCLGLGRLALGMLLPSMSRGLALGYTEMGLISTGNFVGYLAGVLACGRLVRSFGARRIIVAGLLLVSGSMLLLSTLSRFPALLTCYFVTGLGSGLANVAMMGLIAHWFTARRRGRAAGLMICGNGLGIMLSGLLIPWLNAVHGPSGWREGWLALGSLVFAAALVTGFLVRNNPLTLQLKPLGGSEEGGRESSPPPPCRSPGRLIAHLGVIYLTFGFTYIIYATFLVTTLVKELGYSETEAGRAWFWVGLLSLLSGTVFGTLSDRIGRRVSMIMAFSCQTAAYLLLGCSLTGGWIYASIVLFSLVVWSIPSIITATIGDYLPRENVTSAFGTITFIFGIGQVCGPPLAGLLADASGSFSSSYLLAAAMAASGGVLTLLLRPPAAQPLPEPVRIRP